MAFEGIGVSGETVAFVASGGTEASGGIEEETGIEAFEASEVDPEIVASKMERLAVELAAKSALARLAGNSTSENEVAARQERLH